MEPVVYWCLNERVHPMVRAPLMVVNEQAMEHFISGLSMKRLENSSNSDGKTPGFRLIANPFDPPSSVHLKKRLASFSIFDEVRL
jgi:hypothetical protein